MHQTHQRQQREGSARAGVATLTRHKTARKTGKPRLIVFPPAAMGVLVRQRERHGAGYLFRHCRGEPFSSVHLTVRVWGLSKKVGARLTAVGCRHTFATDALAAGVADVHVASLLGHANTAMLYSPVSGSAGDGSVGHSWVAPPEGNGILCRR